MAWKTAEERHVDHSKKRVASPLCIALTPSDVGLQNPQFSQPTEVVRGRRKMALSVKQPEEQQRTPVTLDAERLEDVLAGKDASPKQKEEALKEVSTKPSK